MNGGDEMLNTDIANAERLIRLHGANLRHVKGMGWLWWNGELWADGSNEVREIAKKVAKSIVVEASQASMAGNSALGDELWKWAKRSQQLDRLNAMIKLAETAPEIIELQDNFDKNPFLLACKNCVIDLKNNQPRPALKADLITRQIPVEYQTGAECPRWKEYLRMVTGGDADLQRYIKAAFGYSLTGSTQEQCLFFLYGYGLNGKSVFLRVLSEILGPHHKRISAESLMTCRGGGGGIPNDIAGLSLSRVVTGSELSDSQRLDESKIKDLTGNDVITARFLHGEYFDFTPKFKLWMAGNHKPVITGCDDGIWRRIRLIPFTQKIPADKIDLELSTKLKGELSGILNWALAGCQNWQKNGLIVPECVRRATAEYRAASDVIGEWLADNCDEADGNKSAAADLQLSYSEWATKNGYRPLSVKRLANSLIERGFSRKRTKKGWIWTGLYVRNLYAA